MADVDLAPISLRAIAATPGPWYRVGLPWNRGEPFVVAGAQDPHVGRFVCDLDDPVELDDAPDRDLVADAEFIAHARTDLPALIVEVEQLRRDRDRLRAAAAALERQLDRANAHRAEQAEAISVYVADVARLAGELEDLRDARILPGGAA